MTESTSISNQAWAAWEKLTASDVPKYTKRRNRFVLHDMLERFGEMPSRYGLGFHTEWYHLLDKDDNVMKDAHFFHNGRFACEENLHETAESRGIAANRNNRCRICLAYVRGVRNGAVVKKITFVRNSDKNCATDGISFPDAQSD